MHLRCCASLPTFTCYNLKTPPTRNASWLWITCLRYRENDIQHFPSDATVFGLDPMCIVICVCGLQSRLASLYLRPLPYGCGIPRRSSWDNQGDTQIIENKLLLVYDSISNQTYVRPKKSIGRTKKILCVRFVDTITYFRHKWTDMG